MLLVEQFAKTAPGPSSPRTVYAYVMERGPRVAVD